MLTDKDREMIAKRREVNVKERNLLKRHQGRPPVKDITEKKRGNRKALGRPKGDAAIINEYKARMLASPKSKKVLEAIFNAALDDDHKHQAAAWKLVMDRMLPVAAFEKEIVKAGGRSSIQINISGVAAVDVPDQPPIEGEFE